MTIDMSQFFQVFFDETEELLAEMEKLLLAIDVSSPTRKISTQFSAPPIRSKGAQRRLA